MTPFADIEARVVYDRGHSIDDKHGPQEHGRIGVALGGEVFWTGAYWFPGTAAESYNAMVSFAGEIAARWNAGKPTP